MTVAVEASETTLTSLIETMERGDRVCLQKNGRTIATMVPAPSDAESTNRRSPAQIAEGQAAMDRLDARARLFGLKFDFDEFKADKEYGRR